jgi:ATP-dependent RNA helicase HelY
LFDRLDGPSLAALVSSFTFEARRSGTPGEMPTAPLLDRFAELESLATELRIDERTAGLPRTRTLDAGFARLAYEWAKGTDLRRLLTPPVTRRRRGNEPAGVGETVMTGGDFVRNIKQLVDLLRQIGMVDADGSAGAVAREVAESLVRGVVAASSGVGGAVPVEVADDPPSP